MLAVFDHQCLGYFLGAEKRIQNSAKDRKGEDDKNPEQTGTGVLILPGYDDGDNG